MIGVVVAGDYLSEVIDLQKLREFCAMDDESAKFLVSAYIANLLYGTRYIPKKRFSVRLAKRLLQGGLNKERILTLTKISERTFYRLKGAINER